MAYYDLEPWGRERESFAVIGSIFANAYRGKDQEEYSPHDILSDVPEPEPEEPLAPEEIKAKWRGFTSNFVSGMRSPFGHHS